MRWASSGAGSGQLQGDRPQQAALKLGLVSEADFKRIVDPGKMTRPYVTDAQGNQLATTNSQPSRFAEQP